MSLVNSRWVRSFPVLLLNIDFIDILLPSFGFQVRSISDKRLCLRHGMSWVRLADRDEVLGIYYFTSFL